MIDEKYNELLQAIAQLLATKNLEIDTLHEQINDLKKQLDEAEKQKGK